MKIFYAVQATGNGHISRAYQILPVLQRYGEVDIFLSGSNATLDIDLPVKYRSKGLSLFYKKCGGLNYQKMATENSILRAFKEARDLPVENYDVVINDFDFITSRACKYKNKLSVHFGHQASFLSQHTPRPDKQSRIGEWVLRDYAFSPKYLGLHFLPYDSFILPPVIKHEILQAKPEDQGHLSVYLPSYERHCLEPIFQKLEHLTFHWFLPSIATPCKKRNIQYFPIDHHLFTESLIYCHGLITGGGFETPSEALYLGKKLLCIPIRNHYEQKCNGAALKTLGVEVLDDINKDIFESQIIAWLNKSRVLPPISANDLENTIAKVIELGT